MHAYSVGDRIRITGNTTQHNYDVGSVCFIVDVSPVIKRLTARKPNGEIGESIDFKDAAPFHSIGWNFLSQVLPPEYATLLMAVDGHAFVGLKPQVRDRVLMALPREKLIERIRIHVQSLNDENAANNR